MAVANKTKKVFDNRFEVLSIVGRGAASVVYHARYITPPHSEVALKVLVDHKGESKNGDKLRKEALAMLSSRHPHVLRLDDFYSIGSLCYLCLEYAPESDLRKYVAKMGGTLGASQGELFLSQAASALATIHSQGIIHRDIKPDNVLVVNHREIRICDFGIALLPGETSSIEELQAGVGTMSYMSPEILEGKSYDHRADIYALGVTFYEMISGTHPFEDAPLMKQLEVREDKSITPLHKLVSDVPQYLSEIIMRAMRNNPDDRFADANELLQAIEKKEGSKGSKKVSKSSAAPQLSTPVEQTQHNYTEEYSADETMREPYGDTVTQPLAASIERSSTDDTEAYAADSGEVVPFRASNAPANYGEAGLHQAQSFEDYYNAPTVISPLTREPAKKAASHTFNEQDFEASQVAPEPVYSNNYSASETIEFAGSLSDLAHRDFLPPTTPSHMSGTAVEQEVPNLEDLPAVASVAAEPTPHTQVQEQQFTDHYETPSYATAPLAYATAPVAMTAVTDATPVEPLLNNEMTTSSSEPVMHADPVMHSASAEETVVMEPVIEAPKTQESRRKSKRGSPSPLREDLKVSLNERRQDPSTLADTVTINPSPFRQQLGELDSDLELLGDNELLGDSSLEHSDNSNLLPTRTGARESHKAPSAVVTQESIFTRWPHLFKASVALIIIGFFMLIFRGHSGESTTDDGDTTVAGAQSENIVPQSPSSFLPRFEKESELAFPTMPAGVFKGSISRLIANEVLPLTFISFPEKDQLIMFVGLEGWTPQTIKLSSAESKGKIRVASNGFILDLAPSENPTKPSAANVKELEGSFRNVITGEGGTWKVSPVQ